MKTPTEQQIQAGNEFSSELLTATTLNSLGGSSSFDINDFNPKWQDLILQHIEDEIDSVEVIWMAMAREIGIFTKPTETQVQRGKDSMMEIFEEIMKGEISPIGTVSHLWNAMSE